MSTRKKTILSGIQPSGRLHLGNYFGAIKQHLELQEKGDAFYFIANYHSLTSLQNGGELRRNTFDIALDYLALGMNPEKCTFFAQSDVPQVLELAWILGTLTPVSLMEKGVSYKDKVAQGLQPNIGLFTYPVLQAADILIYHSDLVPVGADQKQNIEISRDLAARFNHVYGGDYLRIPEPHIVEDVATVPGVDGRKMSKSYDNTIDIFDSGKPLKKKVMSITTNSTLLEEPKDPDVCNVYALIKLFASNDKQKEVRERYEAGGFGYGDAKKELLALIKEYFAEAHERRQELVKDPDTIWDMLRDGGVKARQRAEVIMKDVREVTGMVRNFTTTA